MLVVENKSDVADLAYYERNMVALRFAEGWYYDLENNYKGWKRVLSLDNGKLTFHIPDSFDVGNLPQIAPNWDGHTTEEKWERIKKMFGILDYTALQAEEVADRVHAPNPEKARSEAFKRIAEDARKGYYSSWMQVRGVDLRNLCLDLLNRGFDIESIGTPDDLDCYSINVTWGNASSRHIIHRLAMYAKSHYFEHNNWPTCLWLRQDEYDLAMTHYKEPEVTEHIFGAPVSFRIHVDNSLYKT